eukprot:449260_1
MSTIEHIFKPLPKLPLQFVPYMPKPLFYPKHSNTIIISTETEDTNPGIFKYNMDNNNLEKLQTYGDLIGYTECHQQFVDYNNNILHILPGNGEHITMDLKTKTMDNEAETFWGCNVDLPKCVEISSMKEDDIHIVINFENHFKFDCKSDDFIRVNSANDKLNQICDPKLLYVEAKEQIMILGGRGNDNIYCCNINKPYEWKLINNIKMPHILESETFYDVLLFGDIIMVFYFENKNDLYDIWCMDLLYYKWYKLKYNVP